MMCLNFKFGLTSGHLAPIAVSSVYLFSPVGLSRIATISSHPHCTLVILISSFTNSVFIFVFAVPRLQEAYHKQKADDADYDKHVHKSVAKAANEYLIGSRDHLRGNVKQIDMQDFSTYVSEKLFFFSIFWHI